MTIIKDLRDAAMQCSNVDYRATLRSAADELEVLIRSFNYTLDDGGLAALQSGWAYARRVLRDVPKEGNGPGPGCGTPAGSPEPAKLAA